MSKVIRFTVPGAPMGKPRMTRADKWKRRECVVRYRAWADLARECASQVPGWPTDVHRVSWIAYFEPPESWSAKKKAAHIGQLHRAKPDRDNIDKAVLDALFEDDKGVAVGTIVKRWGIPARLEVKIVGN